MTITNQKTQENIGLLEEIFVMNLIIIYQISINKEMPTNYHELKQENCNCKRTNH